MNIKLKAAMDTAVMVGICFGLSGLFALLLNYVSPGSVAATVAAMVALLIAAGAPTYVVYKIKLSDLEMREKYPSIYKDEEVK